jgi:hypothetical protein
VRTEPDGRPAPRSIKMPAKTTMEAREMRI